MCAKFLASSKNSVCEKSSARYQFGSTPLHIVDIAVPLSINMPKAYKDKKFRCYHKCNNRVETIKY